MKSNIKHLKEKKKKRQMKDHCLPIWRIEGEKDDFGGKGDTLGTENNDLVRNVIWNY